MRLTKSGIECVILAGSNFFIGPVAESRFSPVTMVFFFARNVYFFLGFRLFSTTNLIFSLASGLRVNIWHALSVSLGRYLGMGPVCKSWKHIWHFLGPPYKKKLSLIRGHRPTQGTPAPLAANPTLATTGLRTAVSREIIVEGGGKGRGDQGGGGRTAPGLGVW